MGYASRVLIVEDDAPVARMISQALAEAGFDVLVAPDGKSALQASIDYRPAVVLLDLGLPELAGIDVLRQLREWFRQPILILTAHDSDQEKVAALDAGADDYVTKPFSIPVLLARIRAALRRTEQAVNSGRLVVGPYEIDLGSHSVRLDGALVKLTATEFDILRVLMRSYGSVVTHRALLCEVWGPNSVEHFEYLRVYVGQLRKKLRSLPLNRDLIQTEVGVGYRLLWDT